MPLHEFKPNIRPVGLLLSSIVFGGDFCESGIEPGLPAQGVGVRMVRMPVERVRNDHHPRFNIAYERYDGFEVRWSFLKIPIGQKKVPAILGAEDLCGFGGFAQSDLGRSAGSEFSPREIGENHGMTALNKLGKRGAAGELKIVRMGSDG